MALLESAPIALGTEMPEFSLANADGRVYSAQDLLGEKGLLVAFTCNHCPYAQAVWGRLIKLARGAGNGGINTVAINPNINPSYPDDSPEKMRSMAGELGLEFPYLVDASQQTARDFRAQCTPDIYLFGSDKRLVYHGRIDDNWKDESAVTKEDLKEALDNLAAGRPISPEQKPSMGCSIKWVE